MNKTQRKTCFGKVCAKHPELKGERYSSNRDCIGCKYARDSARTETPGYCLRDNSRRRTPKYRAQRNVQVKKRRRADIQLRFRNSLSETIRKALRRSNIRKTESTFALTGCSVVELRQHLERQFLPGMALGKWEVDHKVPVASFDLSDPEQQRKCFHYTNLQPLWAEHNLAKSNMSPEEWEKYKERKGNILSLVVGHPLEKLYRLLGLRHSLQPL
jgi:hypothetical protein